MYPVLIIDDEEPIRRMLGLFLRSEGYQVLEASDGLEGVDMFEEHHPPIVLTDIRMPRLGGLDMLRRIRSIDGDAAVVLITGHGCEQTAVEALRAGATNYLRKPIDINELGEMLRRLCDIIDSRRSLIVDPFYVKTSEHTLLVPSDLDSVGSVIAFLTANCHVFFDRADVNYIKLGLDEMIRNAIEHGNLGLTYEEKSASLENGSWEQRLAERAAQPEYASRRVRIHCRQTATEFTCSLEDEGDGFDWRNLPDPKNPDNLLLSHGRGIMLTSFYYDSVVYNEKGNQVTLTKQVKRAAARTENSRVESTSSVTG